MATAALALNTITPLHNWNLSDIHNILLAGHSYYKDCMQYMNPEDTIAGSLDATKLYEHLLLDSNQLIVIPTNGCGGGLFNNENISFAFAAFMEQESHNAILTLAGRSYAIIRYDETKFAVFDSHGRDINGMSVNPNFETENGRAAILFFQDNKNLIRFVMNEYKQYIGCFTLVPISFTHHQPQSHDNAKEDIANNKYLVVNPLFLLIILKT